MPCALFAPARRRRRSHVGTDQNIVVIGPSGSGKSTLALTLAEALGLRYVELDALNWEPNWTPADPASFRQRVQAAVHEDGWVVAGNYSITRDLIWPRATTVIWLDFALPLLLRRIWVRSWRRWRSRELLWGTNRENFWKHFQPRDESLFWYTTRYYRRKRRNDVAAMAAEEFRHIHWIRLRNPGELERWLTGFLSRSAA